MIDSIIKYFKDPSRLSLLAAVAFLLSILITAYRLFFLPHDLVFKGHMIDNGLATGVWNGFYFIAGITLILGIFAINLATKSTRETVVYLEKKIEDKTELQHREDNILQDTIDLKTFSESLKKIKGEKEVLQEGLNLVCQLLQAGQGALYLTRTDEGKRSVNLVCGFALILGESETLSFEFGEGLVGQVALSGKRIYLDEMPEGYTNQITSGLGNSLPKYLLIVPVRKGETVTGVLELATFSPLKESLQKQVEEMGQVLSENIQH